MIETSWKAKAAAPVGGDYGGPVGRAALAGCAVLLYGPGGGHLGDHFPADGAASSCVPVRVCHYGKPESLLHDVRRGGGILGAAYGELPAPGLSRPGGGCGGVFEAGAVPPVDAVLCHIFPAEAGSGLPGSGDAGGKLRHHTGCDCPFLPGGRAGVHLRLSRPERVYRGVGVVWGGQLPKLHLDPAGASPAAVGAAQPAAVAVLSVLFGGALGCCISPVPG